MEDDLDSINMNSEKGQKHAHAQESQMCYHHNNFNNASVDVICINDIYICIPSENLRLCSL